MGTPFNRKELIWLLLIVTFAIAFWCLSVVRTGTQPSGYPNYDLYAQYYPMHDYASRALRDGRVPLWDPYQYCGQPFLATMQVGVFYPLHVLFLFFPTHLAMAISSVLHVSLAGIFMYLLARTFSLPRFGSLIAALVYMLGGEAACVMGRTNIIAINGLLPASFLVTERLFRKPRSSYGCLLGLIVASQFLAGHPMTFLYSMYALALFVICRVASDARRKGLNHVGAVTSLLLLAAIVLVLVACVQALPTIELWRNSIRGARFTVEQTEVYGKYTAKDFLMEAGKTDPSPIQSLGYVGIAPVLLALLSVFRKEGRGRTVFFIVLCLVSVLFALGTSSPLYMVYSRLSIGTLFRHPFFFLYIYNFSAAILAGTGAAQLVSWTETNVPRQNARRGATVLWVLASAVLLWRLTFYGRVYVLGALVLFVASMGARRVPKLKAAPMLFLALIAFDLFRANEHLYTHPQVNAPEVRAKYDGVLEFVRKREGTSRLYLSKSVYDYSLSDKTGLLKEMCVLNAYEPLTAQRYARFFSFMQGGASHSVDADFDGRELAITDKTRHPALLNVAGVRYIVATEGGALYATPNLDGVELRLLYEGDRVRIFENLTSCKRALLVPHADAVTEEADMLNRLAAAGSSGPACTLLLEEMPSGTRPNEGPVHGDVAITQYKPELVEISASADRPCWLVLTDLHYPGWQAFVDGKETTVYRANYLFRAVQLPPGNHTVQFVYSPTSYAVGLRISMAALALLNAGALATCSLRRKSRTITRGHDRGEP